MNKKTLCAVRMLLIAVVLSVAGMPSSAQDTWPEDCQLPDLEEAISAANAAQSDGDVAAFVNRMSEINHLVDDALADCLESAVTHRLDLTGVALSSAQLNFVDLRGANLERVDLWSANLQGADLEGASLQGTVLGNANLRGVDLSGANLWERSWRVLTCSMLT